MPDVAELGRKAKAKYPKVYDHLDDADVGRKIKAKYPDAYGQFYDAPPEAIEHAPKFKTGSDVPGLPDETFDPFIGRVPGAGPGKALPHGYGIDPQLTRKAGKSLTNLIGGMASTVLSPVESAKTILKTASGMVPEPIRRITTMPQYDEPGMVYESYKQRLLNPFETLQEDPFGALADLSLVAGGVGGLSRLGAGVANLSKSSIAAKAATRLGQVADTSKAVATVADPVSMAMHSVAFPTVRGIARSRKGTNKFLDPERIYRHALQPEGDLDEVNQKVATAMERSYVPGTAASVEANRELISRGGQQTRDIIATDPTQPTYMESILDPVKRVHQTFKGRPFYYESPGGAPGDMATIAGVEQVYRNRPEIRSAKPTEMRSIGPVQQEIEVGVGVRPIPPSRQLNQPAIPMPPAENFSYSKDPNIIPPIKTEGQIAFDPKQVYEPDIQPFIEVTPSNIGDILSKRRISDATIQTTRTPQMSADIPPVPGRHLEGQVGRAEPTKLPDRDMAEYTRDLQTRGVLNKQGFTNEGYRPTSPSDAPPTLLPSMEGQLATRGFNPKVSPTRAKELLYELESTPTQTPQTQAEITSLRQQLATPGAEPIVTVSQAQDLKQGIYADLGDRAYGERKGAQVEALKAVGHGAMDEVARVFPDVGPINEYTGRAMAVMPDLMRAAIKSGVGSAWVPLFPSISTTTLLEVRNLLKAPQTRARIALWLDKKPVPKDPGLLRRAVEGIPKEKLTLIGARIDEYLQEATKRQVE